jgi:hypothetical protein
MNGNIAAVREQNIFTSDILFMSDKGVVSRRAAFAHAVFVSVPVFISDNLVQLTISVPVCDSLLLEITKVLLIYHDHDICSKYGKYRLLCSRVYYQ